MPLEELSLCLLRSRQVKTTFAVYAAKVASLLLLLTPFPVKD
jgi:hypothetical protein